MSEIKKHTHKNVSRNPSWSFPIVNANNVIIANLAEAEIFEVETETDNGTIKVKINSQAKLENFTFNRNFTILKNDDNKSIEIEVRNLPNGLSDLEINYTFQLKKEETYTKTFKVNNKWGEIYLNQHTVTTTITDNAEQRTPTLTFTVTATAPITIKNTADFQSISTTDNKQYSIQKALTEGPNTVTIQYAFKQVPNTPLQLTHQLQVTKEEIIDPNTLQITTCEDLQNIQNNLTAQYELTNSIDCSQTAFTPIGNPEQPFKGSLNGNGHTIDNLKITGQASAGLFGYTNQAIISNVALNNVNITATQFAGGLIAQSTSSTITNIFIDNTQTSAEISGTLIGKSYNSVINNIVFTGTNLIGHSFFDTEIASIYAHSGTAPFNKYESDTAKLNTMDFSNAVLNNGTWNTEIWNTTSAPFALIPKIHEPQFQYKVETVQ